MRAVRILEWKSDPVLTEVPVPEPGPGQVVVRIGGSGACHSDLHLLRDFEGDVLPWGPPFTLGHENAGWVHKLGKGVTGLEVGQPVAVYGPWGCGHCERCMLGMENYCENLAEAPAPGGGGGLGLDGGMAEFLLVPAARQILPLPEGLSPADAAPLTDAGLTPYHAVRRSWHKLDPRATAVVVGVGGLGHLAIQILKATTGAKVIGVDIRPEALTLAIDNGADIAVAAGDTAADQIRQATKGVGADVVLDFVGSTETLALCASVARQMGDLTIVGIAGGTLPVGFFMVPYEVSIQTTYWGGRSELAEVLDLGARGMLQPTVTTFSLDDAVSVYEQLESGKVKGRAVIVP